MPTTTMGNLTKETDPLGNATTYVYDGRRTRVTQPDPDGVGQASSPVTEYVYDALGRMIEITE